MKGKRRRWFYRRLEKSAVKSDKASGSKVVITYIAKATKYMMEAI